MSIRLLLFWRSGEVFFRILDKFLIQNDWCAFSFLFSNSCNCKNCQIWLFLLSFCGTIYIIIEILYLNINAKKSFGISHFCEHKILSLHEIIWLYFINLLIRRIISIHSYYLYIFSSSNWYLLKNAYKVMRKGIVD